MGRVLGARYPSTRAAVYSSWTFVGGMKVVLQFVEASTPLGNRKATPLWESEDS
jgi:hypothetical protein